jgi:rubredoxin
VAFHWNFYRLCPVCDIPKGRGKNGTFGSHGDSRTQICPGSVLVWKDLPRLTEDEILQWRERARKRYGSFGRNV